MLSLKNFRNLNEDEFAFRRVLSIFLEKVATGCVQCDNIEHHAFRAEMRQLQDQAENFVSPAIMLATAGSAAQAMENYNLEISELLRKQSRELQSIVAIITETALKIGGGNTRATQRLEELGQRFERAGALDDLRALKTSLKDCLASFREEVVRQKAESDGAIRALHLEIERRPSGTNVPSDRYDRVTGLPRQTAGLLAMQAALQSKKHLYVVAMVVKGVQSVNARFGFGFGDRMLRVFKEQVEAKLLRSDRIFRWDGPALVVLMDRIDPIGQVRGNIRRILDEHMEQTFQLDGRSIRIPITAEWITFPLVPPMETAAKQIQSFIAGQPSVI
jgi:GGDEF domain-containing protein